MKITNKLIAGLLIVSMVMLLLCACGKDDIGESNTNTMETEKLDTMAEETKEVLETTNETESKGEENEPVQEDTQITITDAKNKLVEYISSKYSDGSVIYDIDKFTDYTTIGISDGVSTYINTEQGWAVTFIPYLGTVILSGDEYNGKLDFVFYLRIIYSSTGFWDYLNDTEFIILAEDGTRYSFNLYETDQSYGNISADLYETTYYMYIDAEDKSDDLANLHEILQREGLSARINYANSDDIYPTFELDDETIRNLKTCTELYYELYEVLYGKPFYEYLS